MKIKAVNLCLIGLTALIAVWLAARGDGLDDLARAGRAARPAWLAASAGLMIGYWLVEAAVLHLAARRFSAGQRFTASLRTSMIGQLFNCVTPFASGGQPVQAVYLARYGMPVGAASCALTVKFIIYQSVLTLYSLAALLLRRGMFSAHIKGLGFWVFLGFGVNAAVIAGLICLCLARVGTRRCLHWGIALLARVRIIKDGAAFKEKTDRELQGFYQGFAEMRRSRPLVFGMALLTAVQLALFFMIPLALYRSFGLRGDSALSIIASAAFVLNMTSFVPLPGAAGGAELGYHAMFSLFVPARFLSLSVLLWRGVTFYLPIGVGFLFLLPTGRGTRRGAGDQESRPGGWDGLPDPARNHRTGE